MIKSKSNDIAKALLEEFILNEEIYNYPYPKVEEKYKEDFKYELIKYQKANVLLALTVKEKTSTGYKNVTDCFELLIFPNSKENVFNDFLDIKKAMLNLKDLIFNEDCKRLTWATSWLNHINIRETNPVSLALFASFWMDSFITITNTLEEFNPQ